MNQQQILTQFPIGATEHVEPITQGLINSTFRVTTPAGIFILQRISTIVPPSAIEDMKVVTDYLRHHGFVAPELIRTTVGSTTFTDDENRSWRLYRYIPGLVHDRILNAKMAREAGQLIGKMHKVLAEFDFIPQGSIPHFHDTRYILKQLAEVVTKLPPEAQELAQHVLKESPATIMMNDGGPAQIIHGDLKISNIIFDENNKAIGVIDFDTILYRSRAIDMGDAYRSWCNTTSEDDADATFDLGIFEAAYTGYEAGFESSVDERALHLQATKQIALELTARFLTDIVTDNYFGFDAKRYPTRQAHNLARAKGQYHLAQTILQK